ncbi:hypothetical protein CE91St47_20430 [Eubacteriales bacterium]|nr:hypothetical protein CE91St47_20430 [Eubacteriales bacterium]
MWPPLAGQSARAARSARPPALALPRVAALRVLAPGGKQGGAVPPSARARRAPDRQSGRAGRGEREGTGGLRAARKGGCQVIMV